MEPLPSQREELVAFLARPGNRELILRDPVVMAAVSADLAPGDPALRAALEAIAYQRADGVFLAPSPPQRSALEHLVAGGRARGVRKDAMWRAVQLLVSAYFVEVPEPASTAPDAVVPEVAVIQHRHLPARSRLVLVATVAFILVAGGYQAVQSANSRDSPRPPSASPSASSSDSPGSATPSTEAATQLVAQLNPGVVDIASCRAESTDGATASVRCALVTTDNRAPDLLMITRFSDRQDLTGYIESLPTAAESDVCGTRWHYSETPDQAAGDLGCVRTNEESVITWSYWDHLIAVSGTAGSGVALEDLFAWWKDTEVLK